MEETNLPAVFHTQCVLSRFQADTIDVSLAFAETRSNFGHGQDCVVVRVPNDVRRLITVGVRRQRDSDLGLVAGASDGVTAVELTDFVREVVTDALRRDGNERCMR